MSKFSFENLHRNHKLAFLDGFLCGLAAVAMGAMYYKNYIQTKAESEAIKKAEEAEVRKMNASQ